MAETTLSVDRPVDRGSNKRAVAGSRSTARSTGHKQRAAALQSADRPVDRKTCTHARTKLPEARSTGSVDRTVDWLRPKTEFEKEFRGDLEI